MSETPPTLEGELVEGRYRIDGVVGSGGFGTVYAAWHLLLETRVALKVLATPTTWSATQRAERFGMFLEEARTLAKLKHPNVISALDAGILGSQRLPGPTPYLVMAWCGGGSMSDLLARGPMRPEDLGALMGSVVDAIAYAHTQGIVHRDLKPSNVMFDGVSGAVVPRVIDFGIAKLVMPNEDVGAGDTMTVSSSRMFTPAYAAPEQVAGAKTGPWTDVHALGLMIVHALVGRPPYGNEARFGAIDPERPTPRTFGVDAGPLEPILARALALRPADRFRDARELAEALARVWPRAPSSAAPLRIALPEPSRHVAAPIGPGLTSITAPPATHTIGTAFESRAPAPLAARTPPRPPGTMGRRVAIGAGLAVGAAAGIAGALGLSGVLQAKSSRDGTEDGADAPEKKSSPVEPSGPKLKLGELTLRDLSHRGKSVGFDIHLERETDSSMLVELSDKESGFSRTSLHLLKLQGAQAERLKEFGRFLIEQRKHVAQAQTYVFDGERGLVLMSKDVKLLAGFDTMTKDLEFFVKGDSIGGGDPAGDAAGRVVEPWSAKTIARLQADELASRLRAANVEIVNGPLGDEPPIPLTFAIRLGFDGGSIMLHRARGHEMLAERKTNGPPFTYTLEGDALLYMQGSGVFISSDLLAQILKGLDAKIQSEPPQ